MAARKTPAKTKAIVDDGPKAEPKPKLTGVTSGVMAPGKVGRAAREAHVVAAPVSDRVIPDRNPDGTIVETRF